jgi:hypothetical protein
MIPRPARPRAPALEEALDTMTKRLAIAVLFLSWLAAPARAAEGGEITATGEAQVKGEDLVAARREATTDALKKAVEQVVGIQIQSEFTSEQREVVKGSQDQFYSAVRDAITQKAEGFIEKYEVIDEKRKGDVVQITVRARVFESQIKAKTQELADLIAKAGHPKLMLVIQEVYTEARGAGRRVARESTVAAYLEKELLERGFELKGAKIAKDLADDSVQTYDRWLDDSGGAARMARDQGADILIAGRVEVVNKGIIEDAGGLEALKGQIRIEISSVIRGVNAASGEVFSTKPVHMTSVGTDEERALMRALKGRGNNVIKVTFDQLLEDLKKSLMTTAERGQSYVIMLRGVTSFRKIGQPFLEGIKTISGIGEVTQKSLDAGVLVVEVTFKGSAQELQQRIFGAMERRDGFKDLDVEGISGKQISLKL